MNITCSPPGANVTVAPAGTGTPPACARICITLPFATVPCRSARADAVVVTETRRSATLPRLVTAMKPAPVFDTGLATRSTGWSMVKLPMR